MYICINSLLAYKYTWICALELTVKYPWEARNYVEHTQMRKSEMNRYIYRYDDFLVLLCPEAA